MRPLTARNGNRIDAWRRRLGGRCKRNCLRQFAAVVLLLTLAERYHRVPLYLYDVAFESTQSSVVSQSVAPTNPSTATVAAAAATPASSPPPPATLAPTPSFNLHYNYKNMTIDWSDHIFKRWGWDSPIVLESHKLLFFPIPKVTCSEFKMLFRRMMGYKDWKTVGSKQEKLHHPDKNGLKYFGSYSQERQAEFLTSEEWTRAVFVRDPRERALSAYLDKGLNKYHEYGNVRGGYIKHHWCQIPRQARSTADPHRLALERARLKREKPHCLALFPFDQDTTPETFPFADFVQHFLRQYGDPHWSKQSYRLAKDNWKFVNFVGRMETLVEDGHALLRKIGAFEEFGRSGWGPHNGSIFETNFQKHATSAREKLDAFYPANNTELETIVLKYYRQDYEHPVLNFTKPERWDEIMGNERK